ncbi:MAG TPA: DNA primase [Solirubrobacterales bacterium]|nr:DNA primase [Solirubrobacterales bacterium]
MSKFASDSVERVRVAADIVEIVSAHTDLRRQGARWVGLCPFHEERTPSFSVEPSDKLYYCFGCGAGGDVFGFVQEKDGVGFPEAVEMLAQRYGVELQREREDPRAEAERRHRARLGELLARAGAFYSEFLWSSPKAAKAREYLAQRGLGEEVLRDFGVGLAPPDWGSLLERAQRAGYTVDELLAAGLAQRGRQGGVYDRFRARITFPIRDRRGRVLGFGARATRPDQPPKYLNSKEGELFHKSRCLFGIDLAWGAVSKAGRAVVVEGYTDALALHQAGVKEAVAVMGTSITERQVEMLSAHVEEVVLALDADAAGQQAMLRAQRVADSRRMRLGVAAMPEGEDPAEMLAGEGGAERFRELLDGSVDLREFQIDLILRGTDLASPADRDRALAEAAPVLAGLGEGAWRDELVRRVSEKLDLTPATVMGRVAAAPPLREGDGRPERVARPGGGGETARRPAAPLTSRERRERALLAMCIAEPDEGRKWLERLTPQHLSPLGGRAAEWLRGHLEDPVTALPREDSELASLIPELVMVAEREPASAEAMELNFLMLEQRRLEDRIGEAGEQGEFERRAELSRERARLVERIAHAERVAG